MKAKKMTDEQAQQLTQSEDQKIATEVSKVNEDNTESEKSSLGLPDSQINPEKTISGESEDNSTKSEISLPVTPKTNPNEDYIDKLADECVERIKKMSSGQRTVRDDLRWVLDLLRYIRDNRSFSNLDMNEAIALINDSVDSIGKFDKRINKLESEQKVIEYERKTFKRNIDEKQRVIDNLERQLREQNSWLSQLQQLQNLVPQFTRAKQERDNFQKERDAFQTEVKSLKTENDQFRTKNDQLNERLDALNADRSTLLAKVGEYGRDKSRTYQAGDRPQNYMLAQEYKTLQEQYLDRLAGIILSTFGDRLSILQEGDRKRKLNLIKSKLSRSILIAGQAIIKGEGRILPKPESETLNMVYVNISHNINFPADSPYVDAFKEEIEHLLSTGLSLASGKVQYPKPEEWEEKDFSVATQEITTEVYKNFEISDTDKSVEQELQNTIKECLQFLQKTALADPPGLLSIETEGAAFDSNRHEIAKGCPEESGNVLDTIYPFYLDNGTVRTKAIVWLEPSSADTSSDSESKAPATQASETKPDEENVKNKTQESPTKGHESDLRITELQSSLRKKLDRKDFFEPVSTYGVGENAHSDEAQIMKDIETKIQLLSDEKIIEELEYFLMNARSLIAFQTEINRVTSSSPNN